ncbi:hypothetical protein DUI87_19077 [Hirundo rustica rustica]|uniref:Uncharacterized protein n=1 Tax=Hirundo rustica rustica TaxID=333673 RepID=A0A3M0JTJ7_HIRRU|nr:hypothetical protein DUI87_19077 [Hirundo rustica rustica]
MGEGPGLSGIGEPSGQSSKAEQDLRIKAIKSHLKPESRLFYFCHRRSSSLVGKYYNWRTTCGSKPQKVPKKLEEPHGEHVAEESHAETYPSGLAFAVESPKHRTLQAKAAVFSLGLKNPIGVLRRSPRMASCSQRK